MTLHNMDTSFNLENFISNLASLARQPFDPEAVGRSKLVSFSTADVRYRATSPLPLLFDLIAIASTHNMGQVWLSGSRYWQRYATTTKVHMYMEIYSCWWIDGQTQYIIMWRWTWCLQYDQDDMTSIKGEWFVASKADVLRRCSF